MFIVQQILQSKRYTVISLSDCTTAVNTALEQQPDLILLDINLGPCDGRHICRVLKNDFKLFMPILLFSANKQYASNSKNDGADGFIQKPFTSVDLVKFSKNI